MWSQTEDVVWMGQFLPDMVCQTVEICLVLLFTLPGGFESAYILLNVFNCNPVETKTYICGDEVHLDKMVFLLKLNLKYIF